MEINAQPGIGIKPLLSLQRHSRISLLAWLLVIVLGLPVVWIKGQSTYSAESVFQVSPRYMKNLKSDAEVELQSNQQYREYVNHLAKTVLRYDVLARALVILREKGIDPKPAAWTDRKYIEKLQTTLYVRAILDTYMVRVGIQGGKADREHLHELVNAVMASFLETSKDEQIYGSSERLNLLQDTAAKLKGEISQMEKERVVLGEQLGLTTFTDGTQNPYDNLLAQSRERLAAAENERANADAVLKAFVNQREIPAESGRSLLEMRLQDLGLQTMRTEVTKRIEELTQQLAGLESKHPARAPSEAEIISLQQRLKAKENEFDRQSYDVFRQRFQATLNQKLQVEQEMRTALQQLESQSNKFAMTFQNAMHLTKGIRELEERQLQIRDRLNYLDTERHALGFVRLVTPALSAEMPSGVGKTKLLIGLIAAAFAAALGIPILIDILDRRIRSVTEAEKLMGMPAAGWQIRREDLPTRIFSEDQTRRFVSALIRLKNRNSRQTFAFTSVKSAGGTTTIILDSAHALQQLGASVLVLEANTFSPFAGFDGFRPGLTEYLAGTAPRSALPRPYPYQGATINVVGIGSQRTGGLQRLDLLMQAVATWTQEYDYVLVDIPPVLLSADAEMLIEALGQIFLVVEAEAVLKGEVGRAKRLLQKIDPEAVGLFVNSVPLFRGSGYMEEVIIETLTRGKLSRFMSLTQWQLQWELLKTQWSMKRRARKNPPELPVEVPYVTNAPTRPTLLAPPAGNDAEDIVELNNCGVLAARAGRLAEAACLLVEVAERAPDSARFQLNAASALLALWAKDGWNSERTRQARTYVERAQKLDPQHPKLAAVRTRYTRLLDAQRQAQRSAVPA
jgi:polysaccharide biosynthesis transport protein